MASKHYQAGMFNNETHVLNFDDAQIEYRASVIENSQAWSLYEQLLALIDWRQDTITVYGKAHLTPRLSCWMGDPWMSYRYSNHTMLPVPWSALVLQIKEQVESNTNQRFNSVLLNYYRDGQDSNSWHSDDEPELGDDPIIASLSLGASRDFQLRHKTKNHLKHTLALENGSVLLMRGGTQTHWQHQLPKRAHAEGRINLTFRTLYQPSSG